MKPRLLAFLMCICSPLAAYADYFSPEYAAQVTARVLKESHSFREMVEKLSADMSGEESAGLLDLGVKKKWGNYDASRIKVSGRKVILGQNAEIEFSADRSVKFNGRVISSDTSKPLDFRVLKVFGENPRTVSLLSLLFPEANADVSLISATLIAGGVVAALVVAGIALVAYIGDQIYQQIKYGGGKVECEDGNFVVKTPSGWFTPKKTLVVKKADVEKLMKVLGKKIDSEAAKTLLSNPDLTCTPESAAKLQSAIQNAKPGQGAPGTPATAS